MCLWSVIDMHLFRYVSNDYYFILQFDTLSVESRQSGTVVLMLSSPEEDVQSKACEAIYKFVDKCMLTLKIV